jgi:gliding motility-associated-like protein
MTTLSSGLYSLTVSDFYGCSDTDGIEITYDAPPTLDLGVDIMIACNSDTLIDPLVSGGTAPYSYLWDSGSIDSMTTLSSGLYSLTVSDFYGCSDTDGIEITYDVPGTVTLSGGDSICDDGTTVAEMNFNFNGLLPWNLEFTNGLINEIIQDIPDSNYLFITSREGIYNVVSASDVNDCLANIVGTAQVIVYPLPVANIFPTEISIYEGDAIELEVGEYAMYHWFSSSGLDLDTFSTLSVSDSGIFYVEVVDFNGCSDVSDYAIVNTKPYTNLFIPNTFTPNGDDHNELFVISGVNIKTFNIQIFNRWGELMFMSESIYKSWDGTFANKKVQEGTYYYQIEVLGNDGKIFKKGGVITSLW